MATATLDFQISGLVNCLIKEGLLTESDAQTYIQEAKRNKMSGRGGEVRGDKGGRGGEKDRNIDEEEDLYGSRS